MGIRLIGRLGMVACIWASNRLVRKYWISGENLGGGQSSTCNHVDEHYYQSTLVDADLVFGRRVRLVNLCAFKTTVNTQDNFTNL